MTHEEYWDYLDDIWEKLSKKCVVSMPFGTYGKEKRKLYFKLTASPYYWWVQDQSIAQSSPKGSESSAEQPSIPLPTAEDSPNLSDKFAAYRAEHGKPSDEQLQYEADTHNLSAKAQEIRKKLKDFTKRHEGKYTDFMSQEAFYGLGDLIRDWAQGCRSWWIGLDSIPDSELVKWNVKHEVFP